MNSDLPKRCVSSLANKKRKILTQLAYKVNDVCYAAAKRRISDTDSI